MIKKYYLAVITLVTFPFLIYSADAKAALEEKLKTKKQLLSATLAAKQLCNIKHKIMGDLLKERQFFSLHELQNKSTNFIGSALNWQNANDKEREAFIKFRSIKKVLLIYPPIRTSIKNNSTFIPFDIDGHGSYPICSFPNTTKKEIQKEGQFYTSTVTETRNSTYEEGFEKFEKCLEQYIEHYSQEVEDTKTIIRLVEKEYKK